MPNRDITPVEDNPLSINSDEAKPKKSKRALVGLCILYPVTQLAYAIHASYFPDEAKSFGATETEVGVIFAMFSGASLLLSLFAGAIVRRGGASKVIVAGIMLEAASLIGLGFTNLLRDSVFVGVTVALRAMAGAGSALYMVSALTILAQENADNFATAIGLFESVGSLGMLIGPLLGSALYSTSGNISLVDPTNVSTGGNYRLPFVSAAGIEVVCGIIVLFLLPKKYWRGQGKEKREADELYIPTLELLKNWKVMVMTVVMVMSIGSLSFLDPTLQPYATAAFHATPLIIGLAFTGVLILYGVFAIVAGKVVEKTYAQVDMILGLVFVAVGFALMGPLPWFPSLQNIPVFATGLTILSISLAFSIVPIPAELLNTGKGMREGGKGESSNAVSALTSAAFSAGSMIGPLLGSSVDDADG
uniref:Major facilitator superfamily (MFS) profile domain-containing protein n=1 Tax=Palpitomonas bilix TaxID=652834 RepID=A0A7S3GBD5_9EUKA|mmetsp:Transcript_38486/g.98991  ORF Transcript_38486/g.98991 Transcript_38486/m.98991 type:complete len:419 (+) Transcript_38486:105-1361(+)